MKYFTGSILVTIFGLLGAFLWGEHVHAGSGLLCVFIAFVLGVLEVSLSFDNAVVNAMKLEKMSKVWQHRFLTWGIIIAVFGMRFLFPILVVAIFANLNMLEVAKIALTNVDKYTFYLEQTHAPIVTFGGMFLLMLFLYYFLNPQKDIHWIKFIECKLSNCNKPRGLEVLISLLVLFAVQVFVDDAQKFSVIMSGISGLLTYLIIDGVTVFLNRCENKNSSNTSSSLLKYSGLISFIYLELIDASFSLDGVLGAFALSKDIIIITIGLAIGAMFVRSLTILLVEKKTLAQFRYLEHGAHWAIGALAVIMFISTTFEVPEVVTGLIGFVFILAAFLSSIFHNKKMEKLIA